jgi:hypothetical protein
MSSFERNDLAFSTQLKGSGMREQYPGMSYQDFWGDEYLWTAPLTLSWKLVSTGARLRPPVNVHDMAVGWWSTPIHLLALGMGWTNLALGLQSWRQMGYPDSNPALRFIKESYGPSIEALEVFLVTRDEFNQELIETLRIHGHKDLEIDDHSPAEFYEIPISSGERYLEHCQRIHNFGPRWEMAKNLLIGGWDSCHLTTHILNSLAYDDTTFHNRDELDEAKVLFITEDRIGIEAPAYKGLPYRLIQAARIHRETHRKKPIVSLSIKTLGHIGDFVQSEQTGRFYLAAEGNPGLNHDLHLIGNLS